MPSPVRAARHRPRLLAAVAAAVLGALLVAAPALAVDEGVPDRDRHPAVGALGFDLDGAGGRPPAFLCTGSVVSDRAFLTAAHCIAAFPGASSSVTLEPGGPATPMTRPGIVFDDFPLPFLVPAAAAQEVVVHPGFDPDTRVHDVALLLFPAGTFAGVPPVALPRAGLLTRLARRGKLIGRSLRLVGYGTDPERGDGEPVHVLEGYRQTATAPVRALTRGRLHLHGDPRRTGRGGLCLGDSGSPQLLGTREVAVSLLTDPGPTCREGLVAQRLDTAPEHAFLARHLGLP